MGYSALMERNEEETHSRVGAELERFRREIEKSHGRVFTFAGDGLMAEFPSAIEALKCSLRVQAEAGKRNARLPQSRGSLFRIGINSGELVLQRGRTGGTAVNIAARLEADCRARRHLPLSSVFEQVRRIVTAAMNSWASSASRTSSDPVMVYGIRAAACNAWIGMPTLPRLTGPRYRMSARRRPLPSIARRSRSCRSERCRKTSPTPISPKEWWTTSSARLAD